MKSLRICCVGDSITGPRPGTPYLHQFVKWPDLLQWILDVLLGEEERVTVANHGYAGNTSTQALARVRGEILPEVSYQIAVILIGGNNFNGGADRETASAQLRKDLESMVDLFLNAGTKVLLLQYFTPRAAEMAGVWSFLNAGNETVAAVACEKGVPCYDLTPDFDRASRSLPLEQLTDRVDGVHLTPGGEGVLAKAVARKLRELGWV